MLFLSHLSLYRLVVRPIIGHSKWATAKKNGICLFFNPLQFSFEGGVVTISSLRKFPIITVHTTTSYYIALLGTRQSTLQIYFTEKDASRGAMVSAAGGTAPSFCHCAFQDGRWPIYVCGLFWFVYSVCKRFF